MAVRFTQIELCILRSSRAVKKSNDCKILLLGQETCAERTPAGQVFGLASGKDSAAR